jgi:hypothetical protein
MSRKLPKGLPKVNNIAAQLQKNSNYTVYKLEKRRISDGFTRQLMANYLGDPQWGRDPQVENRCSVCHKGSLLH